MKNPEKLQQALIAKKAEGLSLLAATSALAEKEDRAFTDEERASLKAISDDGLALEASLKALNGDASLVAALEQFTKNAAPAGAAPSRGRILSMGEQFVQSEAYNFFKQGGHRTQASWRSPSAELFRATTLMESTMVPPFSNPTFVGIGAPPPLGPPHVGDLFAQGTTEGNGVSYLQESAYTNAAAPVAEGAAKPESALTFVPVTDPVRKIAHWLPVSEEMLEDVAQIRSYIDARLTLGVQMEEDDQLLNGTGVSPQLLGLLHRAGLGAAVVRTDPENNADTIFRQIMALYAASWLMPDGIVMNPLNWAATALTKTSTGEYLGGGPFGGSMQTPTLWGLNVAATPAQPAGTSTVGAFKTGAQVFRKGGIRVEASNSHVDFFIKNLVAIRAEERLALAVYRPGSFGEVTGLTGAPGGLVATGAAAGAPGSFTPAGATPPANLASLSGVTASPTTAWTVGQYIALGDLSHAHWSGSAWVAGNA